MRPSGSRLRVFIYRLLPPLNLPISLSLSALSFLAAFPRERIFRGTNPTTPFFARPWGGRGEGYTGAWWPLQRFKSPQRTPTHSNHLHSKGALPSTLLPLQAMWIPAFGTPSDRKRSGRGESWEEGIKFVRWVRNWKIWFARRCWLFD